MRSQYVRRHHVAETVSVEKTVAWLTILACSALAWAAILSWLWGLLW